jgi:ribosomal protein S18 acetylase RimI-like enzyme
MTSFNDNSVQCIFLLEPTEDQIRQIVELYRAQGWWLACDEGREALIPRLIAGSHCFVIATGGGSIVGMGRAISDGISDAYIQDLTVRHDCRNRGIGEMILKALLERLHADGIPWIGLIAEPGSKNLYCQAGFREMSESTPMLMIEEL